MKKIDLYQCEICGTQYKEKYKCQECEKSHVKPLRIIDEKYMPKNCNGEYPVHITVRMANDKTVMYKR